METEGVEADGVDTDGTGAGRDGVVTGGTFTAGTVTEGTETVRGCGSWAEAVATTVSVIVTATDERTYDGRMSPPSSAIRAARSATRRRTSANCGWSPTEHPCPMANA